VGPGHLDSRRRLLIVREQSIEAFVFVYASYTCAMSDARCMRPIARRPLSKQASTERVGVVDNTMILSGYRIFPLLVLARLIDGRDAEAATLYPESIVPP